MSTARAAAAGQLMSVELAAEFIRSGRGMCIAGDEQALAKLPRGSWIGGTITYFIAGNGGVTTRDQVFVDLLPPDCGEPGLCQYDCASISQVCVDGPENGFTLLIVPAFSAIHEQFAHDAPGYEDMYSRPLVGWVAGAHLDDLPQRKPKTVFGPTGEFADDLAVAMHVPLPAGRTASVQLINLFRPGSGPTIRFPRPGFSVAGATIGGASVSLAHYIAENGIDTRLPLVADYCGALINVSIRSADPGSGLVSFYAPVFEGVDYRFADPLPSYVEAFAAAAPAEAVPAAFACNCILNYLYGELEGKRTGTLVGAATFGEIAYQLVNQTLVYLRID
ncbi:MAG: hypothetical protein NVS9B10_30410 [Nevskia sp.]